MEISGSIFSIILVCAEPMVFVAANKHNCPKTNKIQIVAITDHTHVVRFNEKESVKNRINPTKMTPIVLDKNTRSGMDII